MGTHYISWWNVENLFDTETSTDRPEWLQKELKRELKGWTEDVLNKKLDQLASIINKMNEGKGPDILGLCEVENRQVMKKLTNRMKHPGRKYRIIHHNSKDQRGIDISFIYDLNKYSKKGKTYSYEVLKRSATRDILQVQFKTKKGGNDLFLLGNHWPARSAGQYMSAPYRMITGETLSYWLKRLTEIHGKEAAIVVMGDFNDTPYDRSLTEYALSTHSKQKVIKGRNPYLYNLMWELLGERKASYFYNSEPQMLDQFMVTKGILKSNAIFKIHENKVRLEIHEGMAKGSYQSPRRFSRPNKTDYDPLGYSDHFPISLLLNEKI